MSQNWHAHWMEENYKPTRLGNWEIPQWYPQWPDRHCRKTTFQCDNKGHLLAHLKKTNHGRENYKTAWELPKKISRRVAQELSAPPKYRQQFWKEHQAFHRAACGKLSGNSEISEKILTETSVAQKEAKPEPFEPSNKANPEAKEKLTQQSPVLDMKRDLQNLNKNSDATNFSSELRILESDSDSHSSEKKVNKIACRLHQTCKI